MVTQIYFIQAYHNEFWSDAYKIIIQRDKLTNFAGYMARHMTIQYYCMHKHLNLLCSSIEHRELCQDFYNRKAIHVNNVIDYQRLFVDLLELFLEDAKDMLLKHFSQWCDNDKLPFLLAAEPPFATSIARFIVELPISNETIEADFNKNKIHLPSFISFVTSNTNATLLQNTLFFSKFRNKITMIANRAHLFIENDALDELRYHVQDNFLPVPSSTQSIEAKIKGFDLCKQTDQNERLVTYISNIHACVTYKIPNEMKGDEEF